MKELVTELQRDGPEEGEEGCVRRIVDNFLASWSLWFDIVGRSARTAFV